MDDQVDELVRRLGLSPHPEGGFYREIYRSEVQIDHPGIPDGRERRRRAGTLIYFLLAEGHFSAFHRVRCSDEIWHLYAGGPLELHIIDTAGARGSRTLTTDVFSGEPTAVVDAGCWQAARLAPGAKWALAGCTVSPGFEFDDFDMPPREKLLREHPSHAEIIRELTRA
ncbi:MAG: cupin domain-containing protein [Gammaproteobacteria bacterium]|nr:cupin domain-containing protein [Gammaproteobacteria bacterium]